MVLKKHSILAIAIVAFAVTAVLAFGNPTPSMQNAQQLKWFQYLGDVNNNNEDDPGDYELTDAPENCDGGTTIRCAIEAEEDSANPGHPTEEGVENPNFIEFRTTPPTP